MGGICGEVSIRQVFQKVCILQLGEQFCGLSVDMLRKAERVALLRYAHCPNLACPLINILKQVVVNGAVVREI